MKKLLAKIIGAATALAMAIGVGIAVENNTIKSKPVYAEAASLTVTGNNKATGLTITYDGNTYNGGARLGTSSGSDYSASFNIPAGATACSFYAVGWKDQNTTIGISVGSGSISPTTWALTSNNAATGTINNNASVEISGTNNNYHKEFTLTNVTAATSVTITYSSGAKRCIIWGASYESSGGGSSPTVESISLDGNMSNTSYTTVQSWSNSGLTPTITMSDSSVYDGDINWTYSPTTPAAAVIANSKNEVTGGSVTATASAGGENSNSVVTGGISVSYATVAQLAAATPASGDLTGVIAKGIVSQIDSTAEDIEAYHNATYFISDDGTTTNQYEVFRGKGIDGADLTSINDIKVGDEVVVCGDVTTYQGTKEFKQGNYLLSLNRTEPENNVTVTLSPNSLNFDLYTSASASLTATAEVVGSATNGLTAESDDESIATISTDEPASGVAFTVTAHAVGTAHITVTSTWDAEKSASCTVTVVDTTPRLANFKKVDSLESGQRVLITSVVDDEYYYLPSTTTGGSNPPSAVECTYNSVSQRIEDVDANKVFNVSGNASGWSFTNDAGYYLYISGDSNNNSIRVGVTSHAFTANETTNGFYLQSTSYTRYVGVYNKADWRCYNSRTASNYAWPSNATKYNCDYINFWVEAKPDQTISGSTEAYTINTVQLSSTAGSPTWSIVAGDTTAAGASVTAAGVVSATGAGVVKVKAHHDDYEDAFYTITFTVKPEDPFVNLTEDSTSGYVGQNEIISFTYGNLTGSLNITSDNTSVVTVDVPSYSDGSGTVRINFIGAGSANVIFEDGTTELESLSVSVTAPTVSIDGMPASKAMTRGSTLNLRSLLTVTPTGNYSDDLTWTSSAPGVATVNSSGIVTAVSVGSAVITASPDDYPAGSASCTITVSRIISATFSSEVSDGTSAVSSDQALKAIGGYAIDSNIEFSGFQAVYPKANYALKLGGASTQGTLTVGLADGKVNGENAYITKIIVNAMSYSTDGTTILINGEEKALTTSFADYEVNVAGYSTTEIAIQASAASKQRFRIAYISILYENRTKALIEDTITTQTKLSYRYEDNGVGGFNYTNMSIRFGGLISKDLWDELDTNQHSITGFGIMITACDQGVDPTYVIKDYLNNAELAESNPNIDSKIVNYYMEIGNGVGQMETPPESGDNYLWNLFFSINYSVENIAKYYTAVAYIKIGEEYVFMRQVRYSVASLAQDYIDNRGYADDAAGGSLANLYA